MGEPELVSADELRAAAAELNRARPVRFDPEALYVRLDRARRAARLSWRDLARDAHVDHNALHRLAYGHSPSATNLVRLLVWLGDTDTRPYITKEN